MYMFSENKAEDLEIKKKLLENTISRNIQIVFTDTKSILPNENIVFDSVGNIEEDILLSHIEGLGHPRSYITKEPRCKSRWVQ